MVPMISFRMPLPWVRRKPMLSLSGQKAAGMSGWKLTFICRQRRQDSRMGFVMISGLEVPCFM